MSELDDLKKQVADLKQRIDPPPRQSFTLPRFDPTEGMSMPANALAAMMKAVPDSLMSDLRGDARKPNPITGGATAPQSQPVQRGSGWATPIPVEPPPGVAILDKIMDSQDRLDAAERALAFAKTAMVEKRKE